MRSSVPSSPVSSAASASSAVIAIERREMRASMSATARPAASSRIDTRSDDDRAE